jgi:hypothetical protein
MAGNTARQMEAPLPVELYGEAKDTALWIAGQYDVAPADVVARALGLLYFLVLQQRENRRVVTEDQSGKDRRLVNINLRAGDAGADSHEGR